ncbi:AAA family ATPase [Ktedonobacteria bacterium brp13]|nr:AAA family ATPase [Ktedonobacteria bacterium brp13]
MLPPLHISLLGDFLLVSGETPVTSITVPRVQSLLAYLVLHRGAPQNRSHLAFLLWPDSTEGQAHTNLRQLLHRLRQSLPYADQFLCVDKQSLQWLPANANAMFILDIQEMEQALIQADHAEHAQNTPALRKALEQVLHLYRGDLLPDCYEEWILPERDRLRQQFLQAAERLIALTEQEQDYGAAITTAQRLLHFDPLDEATHRQIIRLYALCGNRAAALRTYHTCAQLLERELGAKPSEITQALYTSLMQSGHAPQTPSSPPPKQLTRAPLLGRNAEWRLLQKAWNTATGGIAGLQSGSPRVVIFTGEAGIGKTRLAQELEDWVGRLGMTTASARCYATLGHLAYAPVASWLRSDSFQTGLSTLDPTSLTEISRLVPEILVTHPRLSPPAAMTEGWQRQVFFAALTRAMLSARQPLLLLLDDLHWCDQETLEWLLYLLHSGSDARLLFVGTVRAEEISSEHPLVAFLSALQRDGLVTEIPLGPLTLTETTSLAEYMLGSQLDPAMSNTLYKETEGNPFFVVEMLQADTLSKGESVHATPQGPLPLFTQAASPLPPSVQTVLATRLAQLSTRALAVARVAAVIGREFSFSVLAHASTENEETIVQGMDELWQRHIVREHAAGMSDAYDFCHDKLRVQITISLSPAHRRLLHQRIAEAFKAVFSEDLDAVCEQIAAHYEQASMPIQALPFYQRAGEAASRIYAHAAALHAFKQAASLLETRLPGQAMQRVPWKTAVQVYISLGDVLTDRGSYEDARQAYHRAMTHIPEQEHLWQARLHWKIATTWMSASTQRHDAFYVNGCQEFEVAERILTQDADSASLDWRDAWIALQLTRVWQGKGTVGDIAEAIEKARPIVEQQGTQEQRKLLAQAQGMHNAWRDHYVISPERVSIWRTVMAAMGPAENEAQRGFDLAMLGIGLLCAAQFDEAEEQLRQALQLGERTGNVWVQNNCFRFLPFIFRQRGQVEETCRIITQARSVGFTEHNHILSGHAAWLAWRDGDLTLAEMYGRESVQEEQFRQFRPNPFLWTGRWPLIGVALAQGQTLAAINDVRLLFDPTQQSPREPLNTLLAAVLHTWDAGEEDEARELLHQTLPLAKQLGYL